MISEGLDNSQQPVQQWPQYYYHPYEPQQYFAHNPNRNSQEFTTSRFSAV